MVRLFLWLSGVDRELLGRCTRLSGSERIKFAGLGSLVLIPAVLGLFSMMYAISTVSKDPLVFIAAGVIWSYVILSIDRFLVSTVYQSAVKSSREYAAAIITRYVLAVLVGIVVSHPLVLLWFDESISQRIEEKRREAVSDRYKKAQEEIDTQAEKDKAANSQLQEDLRSRTNTLYCLNRLLTAEQNGHVLNLECGVSGNKPDCKVNCRNILARIKKVDEEIAQLNSRWEKAEEKAENQRNAIIAQANKDVSEIEKSFSRDYLARVNALSEIEKNKPHVVTVKRFILLFFIFVEILPLTLKITTPVGEYEYLRDTLLLDAKLNQDMEKKLHKQSSPMQIIHPCVSGITSMTLNWTRL